MERSLMATTTTNNGWTIPQSTDLVSQGATAIATLGNGIDTSVGTGLKAWTSFTPTMTGWGTGNGSFNSAYALLGKIVIWRCVFTAGTTTTFAGSPTLTIPVTAKTGAAGNYYPLCRVVYTPAAGFNTGTAWLSSTTSLVMNADRVDGTYGTNAAISATVPGTWAANSNNTFQFVIIYEAA
jgi:hypothetical protein